MSIVVRSLARALGSVGRAVRWTLSTVEDDAGPLPLRMPGPAHGPVRAIDLRLGSARRRPRR